MTNNKTPLQEALDRAELWQPSLSAKQCREDYDRYVKAAQAYADLPEKIEGMKWQDTKICGNRNIAIDDILNLLKEGV